MGKKAILIALVCCTFGVQAVLAQEAFTWQLALVKDGKGLPFEEGVTVKDGELFSLEISTEEDCYVYLVVEMENGPMETLLSEQITTGAPRVVRCRLTPPSGQEKFYVIASLTEQKNLQTAIDNYKQEQTARNTTALKNRLFTISSGSRSRPGSVGGSLVGSVRGGDDEGVVYSYSGAAVYSKTIVITH